MFKPPPANPISKATPNERYIYAPQNATVRLNPILDKDVIGLCTDNLRSCLCLIFVGKNGKISLTHTDFNTNVQSFVKEVEWIGEVDKFFIMNNLRPTEFMPAHQWNSAFNKLMRDLFDYLKKMNLSLPSFTPIATEDGIVAIHKSGNLTTLDVGYSVKRAPIGAFRANIMHLNYFFDSNYRSTDLVFDRLWTPETTLTPTTKQFMAKFQTIIPVEDRTDPKMSDSNRSKLSKYLAEEYLNNRLPRIISHFEFADSVTHQEKVDFIIKNMDGIAINILNHLIFESLTSNQKLGLDKPYQLQSILDTQQQEMHDVISNQIKILNQETLDFLNKEDEQNVRKAIESCKVSLDTLEKLNFTESKISISVYNNASSCYRALAKITNLSEHMDQAVKYCDRAISITTLFYTKDSPMFIALQRKLASCTLATSVSPKTP